LASVGLLRAGIASAVGMEIASERHNAALIVMVTHA
jgi:hypothetical protein